MTVTQVALGILITLASTANAAQGGWLDVDVAQHRCPDERITAADLIHAKPGRCLERWSRLGTGAGSSLFEARYRTHAYAEVAVVTEVLFESRAGDSRVRVLWFTQQTSDVYKFGHVALHRVGKWPIVDVPGCLHGTGGCAQELVLWTPGVGCNEIKDLRARFDAALPEGYSTLKAPHVQLDRMIIQGYGWKARACNACASLEMTCHLSFDSQAFALSRCSRRPLSE
jgi:hypothetical protein